MATAVMAMAMVRVVMTPVGDGGGGVERYLQAAPCNELGQFVTAEAVYFGPRT